MFNNAHLVSGEEEDKGSKNADEVVGIAAGETFDSGGTLQAVRVKVRSEVEMRSIRRQPKHLQHESAQVQRLNEQLKSEEAATVSSSTKRRGNRFGACSASGTRVAVRNSHTDGPASASSSKQSSKKKSFRT